MLRNSDGESEILLGNKQLPGIFFVIALLLGVAFAGGYVVGHGPSRKTDAAAVSDTSTGTGAQTGSGSAGETHALPADPSASSAAAKDGSASTAAVSPKTAPTQSEDLRKTYQPPTGEDTEERPLGSKRTAVNKPKLGAGADESPAERSASLLDYTPQSGQTFLQVAAVSRDEAAAIADVLHKKGFHAHAVPKPGNNKIYRILIGPIRSAADLSSTRESLRNKMGFREVIVQRY